MILGLVEKTVEWYKNNQAWWKKLKAENIRSIIETIWTKIV